MDVRAPDPRYYVHAGIRPNVSLDQQTAETKLWVRDSFLRHRGPLPKYIVHGHDRPPLTGPLRMLVH